MARKPSTTEADGYQIGYKRPPAHTRFRKGQSGNPKGRPKRSVNTATLLQDELDKRITVSESGAALTISKRDAFIKSLVARAIKGDARAAAHLLKAIETLEPKPIDEPVMVILNEIVDARMTDDEWSEKYAGSLVTEIPRCDLGRMTQWQLETLIKTRGGPLTFTGPDHINSSYEEINRIPRKTRGS